MRKRSALRAPTQVEAIERGREREGGERERERERGGGGGRGEEGRGGPLIDTSTLLFFTRASAITGPVKAHGPLVGVSRMRDVTHGYAPVQVNGAPCCFSLAPCTSCKDTGRKKNQVKKKLKKQEVGEVRRNSSTELV